MILETRPRVQRIIGASAGVSVVPAVIGQAMHP